MSIKIRLGFFLLIKFLERKLLSSYTLIVIPNGGCKDVMIHWETVSTVIVSLEKVQNEWTTSSS